MPIEVENHELFGADSCRVKVLQPLRAKIGGEMICPNCSTKIA